MSRRCSSSWARRRKAPRPPQDCCGIRNRPGRSHHDQRAAPRSATDHKMDLAGLSALTPNFDWKPLPAPVSHRRVHPDQRGAAGIPQEVQSATHRRSPRKLENLASLAGSWTLTPQTSRSHSPSRLSISASTVLFGVKEQQPRWQTCTAVDSAMGDALGEAFVRKHFTAEAKRRMNEMVENLRATLREELERAMARARYPERML